MLRGVAARRVARSIVRPADYQTPVKTRILAGGIHSAKQQVVRIDRRIDGVTDAHRARGRTRRASRACGSADAVLVSDYGSGLVTPRVRRRSWRAGCATSRRRFRC